jgi:hypothetical protein
MNYDNDDALDAALFALPLEEPPANLRASILAATIYRPAPFFSLGEVLGLGAILAVMLWLVVQMIAGGGPLFVHSLQALGAGTQRVFSNITLLAWIAVGGATAIWLSIVPGFQRVRVRSHD